MSSEVSSTTRPLVDVAGDSPNLDIGRYLVDGVSPDFALRPNSVDELREIVLSAVSDDLGIVPWGGGSQMGLGNLPSRYSVAVDLTGLSDVLRYEPDDMTMSVQTGCRMSELNAMLGEHQQVLPVDATSPDRATIGGLTAVGAAGPRRMGYGPLRDLIIGVTVLMMDGSIATAGGQVVKNVTGFDMMRLHHGALGSLGIILSLNLKVIPKPQSERTVVARFDTLQNASDAALSVVASQLGVTACVVLRRSRASQDGPGETFWTLYARCEAPPSAVIRQAERVEELVGAYAEDVQSETDSRASEVLWAEIAGAIDMRPDSGYVSVRFGSPASRMSGLYNLARESTDRLVDLSDVTLDYGSGLFYVRIPNDVLTGEVLDRICEPVTDLGEHVTLLTGTAELKQSIDVFGRAPAGFSIIESLKRTFDPGSNLNPGRFVGRL